MRYALISDIHGNLPALEAVLAAIHARPDIDATYHLGDLVGYAPWPNEVVTRLGTTRIPGVAGNYDSTVAADFSHCGCRVENPHQEAIAHEAYEWTRAHVSASTKRHLRALPFRIDIRPLGGHVAGPRLVLVHAHPNNNLIYVDAHRPESFLMKIAESAGLAAGDVIAFGHTHKPWHRVVEGVHFVNTGSVGRPKDGDPRAAYVVVEVGEGEPSAEIVRVAYDVTAAADAIVASELPDDLAEFLRTGGVATWVNPAVRSPAHEGAPEGRRP